MALEVKRPEATYVPALVFCVALAIYISANIAFEPAYLLALMDTVFLGIIPIGIAALFAFSYLGRGTFSLLWLGSGLLSVRPRQRRRRLGPRRLRAGLHRHPAQFWQLPRRALRADRRPALAGGGRRDRGQPARGSPARSWSPSTRSPCSPRGRDRREARPRASALLRAAAGAPAPLRQLVLSSAALLFLAAAA